MAITAPPRPRLWVRAEYERMVDAGIFQPGDRVELLEGEIIEMSPEKSRHAATVDLAQEALRQAFGPSFSVRVQHPLVLGDASEPEPDVAVVVGSARDYVHEHPRSAVLIVEVSDTSLGYDRTRKRTLYARAGVREYWILNLVDECLEVYRDPVVESYDSVTVLEKGANVTPLEGSGIPVAVTDLLP